MITNRKTPSYHHSRGQPFREGCGYRMFPQQCNGFLRVATLVFVGSFLALACGSSDHLSSQEARQIATPQSPSASPSPSNEPQQELEIYLVKHNANYYKDSSYVAVERQVEEDSAEGRLRAAIQQLLKGPSAKERSDGLDSIFSHETAGMLNDVRLTSGKAVIDFRDFREIIPGAGTTYGGALLQQQLNHTVFGFPSVQEVEYQIDGSCDLFWEWQQAMCFSWSKRDWESGTNPLADK